MNLSFEETLVAQENRATNAAIELEKKKIDLAQKAQRLLFIRKLLKKQG